MAGLRPLVCLNANRMTRLNDSQTARLLNQFETVLTMADALPEEPLRYRSVPDKWSAFEQLAHIGCYTAFFHNHRLRVMLRADEPPAFGRYRAENDPAFAGWTAMEKASMLARLVKQRRQLTNRLMSLTEAELSRKASHPLFGKMDVPGWTEFFLLHEAHHLYATLRLIRS